MRAGRIEVYVHSDSATENKGACVLAVVAKSDFAARTEAFIGFARKAADRASGASRRIPPVLHPDAKTTLNSGSIARMRRYTSRPLSSGIIKSSSTQSISARRALKISRAC